MLALIKNLLLDPDPLQNSLRADSSAFFDVFQNDFAFAWFKLLKLFNVEDFLLFEPDLSSCLLRVLQFQVCGVNRIFFVQLFKLFEKKTVTPLVLLRCHLRRHSFCHSHIIRIVCLRR
jgi:hypothetical protein